MSHRRKTKPVSLTPCNNRSCSKAASSLVCRTCRDKGLKIAYCSSQCQKEDKRLHETRCGLKAFVFHISIPDCVNPPISRTVIVPAWYTFEQFHLVIQWGFGWENREKYEFNFPGIKSIHNGTYGDFELDYEHPTLQITTSPEDASNDDTLDDGTPIRRLAQANDLHLDEVFGRDGKYRSPVSIRGRIPSLEYNYDLDDPWPHLINMKSTVLSQNDQPIFTALEGRGPIEGVGGPEGWNLTLDNFRDHGEFGVDERESIRETLRMADQWPGSNVSSEDPFTEPPLWLLNDSTGWSEFYEEIMGSGDDSSDSGEHGYDDDDNDNDTPMREFDARRARSLYGPAEYGIPGPSSVQMNRSHRR